jgi:hypothetical protein
VDYERNPPKQGFSLGIAQAGMITFFDAGSSPPDPEENVFLGGPATRRFFPIVAFVEGRISIDESAILGRPGLHSHSCT